MSRRARVGSQEGQQRSVPPRLPQAAAPRQRAGCAPLERARPSLWTPSHFHPARAADQASR